MCLSWQGIPNITCEPEQTIELVRRNHGLMYNNVENNTYSTLSRDGRACLHQEVLLISSISLGAQTTLRSSVFVHNNFVSEIMVQIS